jgi:hypothetical protein
MSASGTFETWQPALTMSVYRVPPGSHPSACGARVKGKEVSKDRLPEERVIWRKQFHAEYFDFRGKSLFTRFDGCEFVKCTLHIDRDTEQLAFTGCVFKDCNIDHLE